MSNYTILSGGVREYKNFITVSEATELVEYLEANKGNEDLMDMTKISNWPTVLKTVRDRAMSEVEDLANESDLEVRTLMLWKHPKGASTKPSDFHHFSFLIYLNEDYDGGEFIMPSQDITHRPKALSMLLFESGNEVGVNTVTEGERYSMGGAVRLAGVV